MQNELSKSKIQIGSINGDARVAGRAFIGSFRISSGHDLDQ